MNSWNFNFFLGGGILRNLGITGTVHVVGGASLPHVTLVKKPILIFPFSMIYCNFTLTDRHTISLTINFSFCSTLFGVRGRNQLIVN